MNTALLVAIFSLLGVTVTASVTYLISRRQNSGTVHHAEADVIFKAAETLREEQRAEVLELRAEILSLRSEILSLRTEIASLREEASKLRTVADALRAENAVAKTEAQIQRRKAEDTAAALAAVQRDMTNMQIGAK